MFSTDEHRGEAGVFQEWPSYHDCLGHRWQGKLCLGRVDFCGGSGNPMVARRNAAD